MKKLLVMLMTVLFLIGCTGKLVDTKANIRIDGKTLIQQDIEKKKQELLSKKWVDSKFVAKQDSRGNWRLLSMPDKIYNDPFFRSQDRLGLISYIIVHRDKGVWNPYPASFGPWSFPQEIINEIMDKVFIGIDLLDILVPDDPNIGMAYWADFNQAVIFFNPERQKDEKFHKKLADILNADKVFEQEPARNKPLKDKSMGI